MEMESAAKEPGDCDTPFEVLLPAGSFGPDDKLDRPSWAVRSIGFIAKPDKTRELTACLEGPVSTLLRETPGFAGLMVMHSQHEERNLLVFAFWETEKQAANHWEEFSSVRRIVSPLVDVCAKVQTFHAAALLVTRGAKGKRAAKAS